MINDPIERHVGKRLKMRRLMLGLSQEELGNRVGVTFQQIQKYENGSNRMSSARLFQFANILNVGIEYFFQKLSGEDKLGASVFCDDKDEYNPEVSTQKEVLALIRAYTNIKDPEVRKKVLSLIKTLANCDEKCDEE